MWMIGGLVLVVVMMLDAKRVWASQCLWKLGHRPMCLMWTVC